MGEVGETADLIGPEKDWHMTVYWAVGSVLGTLGQRFLS